MKNIIVANWKMNPSTIKEAEAFVREFQAAVPKLKNTEIVICPPFVYLDRLSTMTRVRLGSQNVFYEDKGSYTGEVSVGMLKNLGVKYAIVGHSERRNLGETDEIINKKIRLLLKKNLKVIFCVGEKERDEKGEYLKFIKAQIIEGLKKNSRKDLKNLIVAYEPVWAISSSKNSRADTPEEFLQTAVYIRRVLFFRFGGKVAHETPILYGGSVDASNVRGFLDKGQANGLLVGRASQGIKSFLELLKNLS